MRNKKTRARRMCIGDLLGLAEDPGKCGFFLDPHTSILWVKNGIEVRVDDSICGPDDARRLGEPYVLRSSPGQRRIQGGGPNPKCHPRQCNLLLAGLRSNPFPSGPPPRKASDLNIRTTRASGGDRTFLRPRPIFALPCDSGTGPGPPILSSQRRRMVLLDRDWGSNAGSMDAEARLGRAV
jgi:hypothetical protein